MRELMKFRGLESTTTSITSATSSSSRRSRNSGSNSGSSSRGSSSGSSRTGVSVSSMSRLPFQSSTILTSSTEAGVRTSEMNAVQGTLGLGGKTTKVEVLSDGLKWLVIYSLLPSSSAGAAMSGMGVSGLEVVSRTVDASSTLGSLGTTTNTTIYQL